MTTLDPTTNAPLPPDAVQRVLFVATPVHIYAIPPLTSTKGHLAAHWTNPGPNAPSRQIFTARLRILETALPSAPPSSSSAPAPAPTITTSILLEDPTTGHLFAAAPYTSPSACDPALDSARFFALRVASGAQKATVGIGFEERSLALDFSIALQEVRKGVALALAGSSSLGSKSPQLPLGDFALKAGEMIHVDLGRAGRRPGRLGPGGEEDELQSAEADERALFSIAPPPRYEREEGVMLPPPPPPLGKAERRGSGTLERGAAELGFDDGEFGEFV